MLPKLIRIMVTQQREATYVVSWQIAVGPIVPPGTNVKIYRSYHPVSGFEEIADVPVTDLLYVDADHRDYSKNLYTYYKLEVYLTSAPATTQVYGPTHAHDRPNRIGQAITRRMEMVLKVIQSAVPVLIYQLAYGDPEDRNDTEYDRVTGQVISGESPPEGFDGDALGYYDPILTLMDIQPAQHTTQIEDLPQHVRVTAGRMSNYPLLRTKDIIREVNTGILWMVTHVTPVTNNEGAILTQDPVSLRQIKHGDLEWKLPVPDSITPVLKRRRARYERILQDNEGGTPRFLEVYV